MWRLLREKLSPLMVLPKPIRLLLAGSAAVFLLGLLTAIMVPWLVSQNTRPKTETKEHQAELIPSEKPVSPADSQAKTWSPKTPDAQTALNPSQPKENRGEDPIALRRVIELYLESGEYGKAVPFVDQALAQGLGDTALWNQAAKTYLAVGSYAKALTAAQTALRLDSSSLTAWRVLSMATYRLGNSERGMVLARQALIRFPDQVDLLVDLGTMEVEMGSGYPDFGKTLAHALRIAPDSQGVLYLLGREHALEGDFGEAAKAFRQVLRVNPEHAKAWAQLGIAYYQTSQWPEAGDCIIRALQHNPRDYNSWFNLGEWYTHREDAEENPDAARMFRAKALQSYLHAVELNPDHVQAQYRVGVILHGNGQYKEAIRHFEAAVRCDSTHISAWFQMGVAYQRLSMAEQARICLRRAFELDPLNRLVIAKLRELSDNG